MTLLNKLETLLNELDARQTHVAFGVFQALKEAVEGADPDYDHSLAIGPLLDSIEAWCVLE